MMPSQILPSPLTAWREIDLSAITSNYRAIRAAIAPSTKIFACLKQDACGCGAGTVAAVLSAEGVDAFGLVSVTDALAVRTARLESQSSCIRASVRMLSVSSATST